MIPILTQREAVISPPYHEPQIEQHTLFTSIVLHLFPGVCVLVGGLIAAPIVVQAGFPVALAQLLSALLIGTSLRLSVWLYMLIVFGLSWPLQLASVIWSNGNVFAVYVLNSTAMLMVAVGTYLAGRYVFRDGFAGAGWSWGKPSYYLAVIGLASAVWLVPTCLDVALGG